MMINLLKAVNKEGLVKSIKSCHSCENGSPEPPELHGFPLPRE
jgi:hypothetical protein